MLMLLLTNVHVGEIWNPSIEPNEFGLVDLVITEVHGVRKSKPDSKYKPRGLRWSGVKPTTRKTLKKEINLEKNCIVRPYSHTSHSISPL